MTTEPANVAKAIFLAAIDQHPPHDWPAFLDEACNGNVALRTKVEKLLRAQSDIGAFCETPGFAGANASAHADSYGGGLSIGERPGTAIGPYRLLDQLGEGGCGTVFLAEQREPIRRQVALKVVKPGMDSREVIARFEAERQALALMDHPNIAQVLDAGAADSGRPYFVMELVKGAPITEFCDQNRLAPAARLRLFIDVCHAIQHAHHKGVIHRDIKPTNVLVTLHGGTPVVKVIDFGVAKAMAQRLTEQTLFTSHGQMIGTPAYMSPEQAAMSGLDIDTRTDVYSLGVLLYELLTGTTPLERERLRYADYGALQRLIRDDEPPRPSARLTALGSDASTLAGARAMEVKRLARLLAGDLDWVVMKALEKDRNRRYNTPASFAEDVERYLRREAVVARPPSTFYKVKKFTQRHRPVVWTAAAVAAALLTGTAAAAWQAVEATRAQRDAWAAAAAEKQAKQLAQAREAEVRAVLRFVEDYVFTAGRPEGLPGGLGHAVSLRRAVEAALPSIEKTFAYQPLVEARLRTTLGQFFLELGEARIAAEQCEIASNLYRQHLGSAHADTLRSMDNLARSYHDLGRYGAALDLRERTLALRNTVLGPDHADTLRSMDGLADSYAALARHTDALKLREETLALYRTRLGPEHPDTLRSMSSLADSYASLRRRADALQLREATLALCKARLGARHPDTLLCMHSLANSYTVLRRHRAALTLREETLALMQAAFGPDHPLTWRGLNGLAVTYFHLGRHADALRLFEQTLALQKARLGADHPDTFQTMYNLAISYAALDRPSDAMKLREKTMALHVAKLGPEHPRTLMSMNSVAFSYAAVGRHSDALRLFEEALASQQATLGPDHPGTLLSTAGVAHSLVKLGRGARALPLIDVLLEHADDQNVRPAHLRWVIRLRLRHFQQVRDAAGCRQTADIWENLQRRDANSLCHAARLRAVTAGVLRAVAASPQADAEADRAMAWLNGAVAAGYKDAAQLERDRDFDTLRDRPDFRELMATLKVRPR
jgi:serine/threonine protein kinase